MKWHIGCSGFHYKHWKGTFYPEGLAQKRWFEFYTAQFGTLELNVTFYRFPRGPVLRGWYERSPEDFRFSVKAPKAITHFKQFHGTSDMLSDFYGTIREGLGVKLGPVLFQFPPRFHYEPERLQRVLDQLDLGFNNVLEFRHTSWWCEEVYTALRHRGLTFCGMSHPDLPAEPIITGSVVYYRFHGVPELYRSYYSEEALAIVADKIRVEPGVKEVWCYFNNDAAVAAIPNAHTLIDLAGKIL
ncbi:Uncharacterized conserved protein YecE, DUF72 family [Mucilaginibacter pineti]|uniref:Uncharacterized conserved protein YecE, DUF72 family n=1 Tax=Mucilaginibacter pineti TaxID=1391627 RepID=A0A1G7H691_9SPHI|nr:DUF72 domain-containing protein [Mucilaginibacter pineti]SDE95784.1 Uncharacterized conserved protein YecE, DUF72 family [Mucilaginibacter pineti]